MNAQRAQEIMNTDQMVSVMYHGDKVYIEHVDRNVNKATIHPIDHPEEKHSVSVDELMEQE